MPDFNRTTPAHKILTLVAGLALGGLILVAAAVSGPGADDKIVPAYVEPVAVIEGEPSLVLLRTEDGDKHLLPRCLHEDSMEDCFWFAEWRGNGEGQDFAVIDETVVYL